MVRAPYPASSNTWTKSLFFFGVAERYFSSVNWLTSMYPTRNPLAHPVK